MAKVRTERQIAGRTLSLETGKIGRQALGAVWVQYADTVVFAAAVSGAPRPGQDFFSLTVDYREKTYAAGKIPGGFFKREGRPTTKEILTMRLIDRPIRPLFPEAFIDEVLIQAFVLSADQANEPDILAMVGSSAALMVSGLPYEGPIGAVRVARVEGRYVFNPTMQEMEYSDMEMVLAGHKNEVNMIELGGRELSEDVVLEGIRQGHEFIKAICEMQEELRAKAGKPITWKAPTVDRTLEQRLNQRCRPELSRRKRIEGKQDRAEAVQKLYDEVLAELCPEGVDKPEHDPKHVTKILHDIEGQVVRDMILDEKRRADGRGLLDIRPIDCEVAVLPRTHGSAIFQRGETQALVVATLGTVRDEQIVDGLVEEYSKKFMLHYNFPPICTGEVKRVGAVSRREIGHGNLAEKSLEAVLPSPDTFPYTIRLVSDIMESNGSSSMASVCGGTLALMDAGVPIRQPVAGISIGMVSRDSDYVMLVDILGEEDHFGDMDFKVAGTQFGITGVQVDLKGRGLTIPQIGEAMTMAQQARIQILKQMLQIVPRPNAEISRHAPRIFTTKIHPDKIGRVIGPAGKNIKAIEAQTGAKVEIEEDGTIYVSSTDAEAAERALAMVEASGAEVKVGKIYSGRVASIKDFGAFIQLFPGVDGLCHISELSDGYVKQVSDVCKVGDEVKVKVILVDEQGRIKLSKRAADAELNGSAKNAEQ
jgi:polyribonucleotide nucleotidyltransferase